MNIQFYVGFGFGVIVFLLFFFLILDNLYLRRKIFKMYERLLFQKGGSGYKKYSSYDEILKDVK